MIKLKTKLFIITAALLCMCSIGCGKKTAGKRVTLTVVHGDNVDFNALFTQVANRFKKQNPDIDIRFMRHGGAYYDKLTTMLAGNVTVDVFWMGQGFPSYAEKGQLLNLGPAAAASGFKPEKYYPGAIKQYYYGDKLYGVPFGVSVDMFFYNSKHLAEEGIAPPSEGWTWADLQSMSRKLTKPAAGGRVGQYGICAINPITLIRSFNGDLADEQVQNCTLYSPQSIKALTYYHDLMHRHKTLMNAAAVSSLSGGSQSMGMFEAFSMGLASMGACYSWNLKSLVDNVQIDWNYTVNPTGEKMVHWLSTECMCVSADTKFPAEAAKLALFFAEESSQRLLMRNNVPTLIALNRDANARKGISHNWRALDKIVSAGIPTPRTAKMTQFMQYFWEMIEVINTDSVPDIRALVKKHADMMDGVLKEEI